MALTFTKYASGVHGDQRYWQGEITLDASYPTGGEAVVPSDFNLTSIVHLMVVASGGGTLNRGPYWDAEDSKIIMTVASSGAEVADTTDMSAYKLHVSVYGH